VSKRIRPDGEQALLGLVVDDAEEFERMIAEGHRELCLEYQPLIPGIVDAAVMGRQLTGELKAARDYLQECPVCAEGLEASSKALRALQDEDGQEEDEPHEPPRKDPPPTPDREPGGVERWWLRFTRTRAGLISVVGGLLCVVALVGLFLQSGRQCAREEAQRDHRDAGAPVSTRADAGSPTQTPDASMDPRSWLRKKGPLSFVFITLHLAGQRQRSSQAALVAAQKELATLGTAGMAPALSLTRLTRTIEIEATAVARLSDPLKRAAAFVAQVKNDGSTADFDQQLAAAKKYLAERRQLQTSLLTRIAAAKKQLAQLTPKRPR
jgi:hypothetical protein